jgi:hypothetical protein
MWRRSNCREVRQNSIRRERLMVEKPKAFPGGKTEKAFYAKWQSVAQVSPLQER